MRKEVKIGVFVVTVLVVSFFLINYLRGEDIFNREIEVCSTYDDVEGLVASAPVYIKGYKAGKVSEVSYDPESEVFNVVCSIRKEFRIPADSRMTIYSVDIMGGKGVRIDLGTSPAAAEDGDVLAPAFEAGLMDGLSDGVAPLLEKVTSAMDSLSVTVSGINRLLADENQVRISRTLAHLEMTMASVGSIADELDGKSSELNAIIDNMANLSSTLESVAEKADTVMTGVNDVVSSVAASDIAGIVGPLKELVGNINDPDGSVGKLFVDDSVYDSLDSLLTDIDLLVRKIQENPKKYLKISVF